MKIIIVSDRRDFAEIAKKNLQKEGYIAEAADDAKTFKHRVKLYGEDYDLIILGMLQDADQNMEFCVEIRNKQITTPIIVLLTTVNDQDITANLNAGADECLAMPQDFSVLMAYIKALLRRPRLLLPIVFSVEDLIINFNTKQVFRKNQEIKLTLKEFSLLEYFVRHPNQALNREQILSNLWDFAFDSFSNVVDVHVTNLRKKIGDNKGRILKTVYGIGYKLDKPDAAAPSFAKKAAEFKTSFQFRAEEQI